MRLLLLLLLLAGCPAPETDDDDTTERPRPPEADSGCDAELTQDDLCDGPDNAAGFATGSDFCAAFWDAVALDDGSWQPLPTLWALPFADVSPAEVIDYWEYRNIQGEQLSLDLPVDVIAGVGELCATASDATACVEAWDALRSVDGFVSDCGATWCSADSLAWNRGDAMGLVTDDAGMRGFLGAIDSFTEALLLAAGAGFQWASGDLRDGAWRPVGDGFEFVLQIGVWSSPYRLDAAHVGVDAAGTITTIDRAIEALDCGQVIEE